MGRPRKPTAQHELEGTYRKDRHGDRALEPAAAGVPAKPKGLSKEAAALWDHVVTELVTNGTAKRMDTAALQALCEVWGLYRKAVAAANKYPIDKEVRCAVTAYLAQFERLASRFGLTPESRARIRVNPPDNTTPKVAARQLKRPQ